MRIVQSLPLDPLLRRLALELTGLPLLELGWALAWGGWASADTGGRLDLSFGLKIHFELFLVAVCRLLALERTLWCVVVVMISLWRGGQEERDNSPRQTLHFLGDTI